MVYLAYANGSIAVVAEVTGQRNDIRDRIPEICIVLDDPIAVRSHTGHQAGTRRAADRFLTIGAIETYTFFSKSIYIRAMDNLFTEGFLSLNKV